MTQSMPVRIPAFSTIFPEGIPFGNSLLIEFDADSHYYQILESLVHDLLSAGHMVSFFDYTRFPDEVRKDLKALGSDVNALEENGRFHLYDGYSATLGAKSKEALAFDSLKIADLSLKFLQMTKKEKPIERDIGFSDNGSITLRYNEEKPFIEFYAARVIPRVKIHERISFSAFVNGLHSTAFYKAMEDAVDGVIDVKLDDSTENAYTKLRVRIFKKGQFNGSWKRVVFTEGHASLA